MPRPAALFTSSENGFSTRTDTCRRWVLPELYAASWTDLHISVVSAIPGHEKVQLAMEVYDHCDREDVERSCNNRR